VPHYFSQIAAADVLLLNKSDLVSEPDLLKIEFLLHQLNPSIPIYRTIQGKIDLSKIMGIGAYSEKSRMLVDNFTQHQGMGDHDHCADHEHEQHGEHGSSEARHAGISNILVHIPKPLTASQMSALDEWIQAVLWEGTVPFDGSSLNNVVPPSYPATSTEDLTSAMDTLSNVNRGLDTGKKLIPDLEVLRCKGIWWNNKGEQFVLQGVRHLYDVSKIKADTNQEEEMMAGKLVFIGKGLNEAVKDSLRQVVGSKKFM